ncbi:hypothetical protein TorRG33x02_123910 [Trema orientale]|uniref:Uncharacterized protein n=1 Tax=Trema orientale TaxID=63057 RepID=A0A2P5F1W5_TREOI|nr:hypothetical protein TorRG33x02_123910 [Trema orientale]
MDESFRARVDKVFGSLASSGSSSSSLWSITDDEVERREWRRCPDTSGRDDMPCSSSFDEFLKKGRRRNFDHDDPERIDGPDDNKLDGQDEWSIRSSIGLDRTLDYEEEEDEFDKVASGSENVGDRLYMSDVTQTGSYLNSHNVLVLPNNKDPRANHLAARFRLKEDEDEAQNLASTLPATAHVKEPDAKGTRDGARPKPILKRKDNDEAFKSQKRVRFDVGRENDCEESFPKDATVLDCGSLMSDKSSGVPDYLVNPSKYTCYSFSSTSEVDEISNPPRACGEFHNQVKGLDRESGSDVENAFADLPKSVTFIPKKKAGDGKAANDGSNEMKKYEEGDRQPPLHQGGFPVGVAAGEVQGEVSGVEEDELETEAADGGAGLPNTGRRYRTMLRSDDSDT